MIVAAVATTFMLVAFVQTTPGEPEMDSYVIDVNMSETDCDAAVEKSHTITLEDGTVVTFQPQQLSCEEEWK